MKKNRVLKHNSNVISRVFREGYFSHVSTILLIFVTNQQKLPRVNSMYRPRPPEKSKGKDQASHSPDDVNDDDNVCISLQLKGEN